MNTAKRRKGRIKKSLAIQAYELLKEKMTILELPPGMKLEEQNLMDMLKFGRTPIREAIKMLISEGLIVSYGTNATYVKNVTLKSAKDQRRFVSAIGAVAFDLANPYGDFSDIIQNLDSICQEMDEVIKQMDMQAFTMLNAEFHKTLAKAADNEFVDELFEKLYFLEARQGFIVAASVG